MDKLTVISPADGRKLTEIAVTADTEIRRMAEAARQASYSWSRLPYAQRASALRAARNAFATAAPMLVQKLTDEVARPEAESWFAEIVANLELFDYWIKNAGKYLEPERVPLNPINYPGKKGWIEYQPVGVIGLITPWNFPVSIPLRALIPGLLAGNGFLWKPSEYSAAVGQALYEVLAAHLPAGLLGLVQGAGAAGSAVVDQADAVIFTGSVATGRRIELRCAERSIRCSLELGGKDAAYVTADANMDRAVNGILWGAFNNCGQNCASVERIYVHKDVYESFLTRLEDALAALRKRSDLQVGPVINDRQAQIVTSHLSQAVSQGAIASVGGGGEGRWVEPTVLRATTASMTIVAEETFGPMAPVMVVESHEAALAEINRSRYGLTCSLWTTNYEWARSFAREIRSGVVTVNNHGFTAAIPGAPWVGRLDSGSGVTNSHIALHEMVRPRFYLEDRSSAARELWWYPYHAGAAELARTLVSLQTPGGFSLGKVVKLIKLFIGRWRG